MLVQAHRARNITLDFWPVADKSVEPYRPKHDAAA